MVNGAGVAFFPNVGVNQAFANEFLIGNFGDHELARREEANDVVDFGAIRDRFVLFEAIANETFFVVDVKFAVGDNDFTSGNGIKSFDFCFALAPCSKTFFEVFEVIDGVFDKMC